MRNSKTFLGFYLLSDRMEGYSRMLLCGYRKTNLTVTEFLLLEADAVQIDVKCLRKITVHRIVDCLVTVNTN